MSPLVATLLLAVARIAAQPSPATSAPSDKPAAEQPTPVADAKAVAEPREGRKVEPSLDLLAQRLEGTFYSDDQASKDPENYYALRMHCARVWNERADGAWFYVEHLTARQPARPFRQRVYRVTNSTSGAFTLDVFTLPDPKAAVNCWKNQTELDFVFDKLRPEHLAQREGCSIKLTWDDQHASADPSSDPAPATSTPSTHHGAFVGSTSGSGCTSDLRDAKYSTTTLALLEETLILWERGYDAKGKQVVGPSKGGYVYVKLLPGKSAVIPEPAPAP